MGTDPHRAENGEERPHAANQVIRQHKLPPPLLSALSTNLKYS